MSSLRALAIKALGACDVEDKCALTHEAFLAWKNQKLSIRLPNDPAVPDRPGRPDKPLLVAPTNVKKRSLGSSEGRFALLHALAHIELNAIDLALDIAARFASEMVPHSFFTSWMKVADDEARHFALLNASLREMGGTYGDLPAHDGLWEAAHETRLDLHARLAIVPLVLEARGLDVTPSMVEKLLAVGDSASADILRTIYEDEKTHVAVGAKWFRFYCAREKINPADAFRRLVQTHFRGHIRPPFNDRARSASGLTPSFYRTLSASNRH